MEENPLLQHAEEFRVEVYNFLQKVQQKQKKCAVQREGESREIREKANWENVHWSI